MSEVQTFVAPHVRHKRPKGPRVFARAGGLLPNPWGPWGGAVTASGSNPRQDQTG